MTNPETTAEERRLLRRASKLLRRSDGLVYLDGDRVPTRAPRGVADSLLEKGLLASVGARFERTAAGDQVLARWSS